MKKQIKTLSLALLFLVTIKVNAQENLLTKTKFEGKTLFELAEERRTKALADHNSEEHLLLFKEREIMREFLENDIDGGLSHLAEDAMVNPPGIDAVFGRENQALMFKELLAIDGVLFIWEPIQSYVNIGDSMGYVYGLVLWKMPNEKLNFGKYISIYQKVDGEWKNQVEIRNIIRAEK